jgi:hypothetical protein
MEHTPTDWTNLDERRHILDYDSSVAMRYHIKRRAFLEALDRIDPAITVIFGSAAFATILTGHSYWAATAAGIATIVSAINLAFGIGERARLHDSLYRRWAALKSDLVNLANDAEPALRQLEVKRAEIDADSPAQLKVLTILCDDAERRVRGEGGISKVRWWQHLTANLLSLPPWRLEQGDFS